MGSDGHAFTPPDLSSILAARTLFAWMFPATFFAVCGLTVALAHRPKLAVFRSLMVAIPVVAGLALARQRGVHLLLAFIPEKFRVYRPYIELPPGSPLQSWTVWPIRESFADLCRTEAVVCLDLTIAFQRALDTGGQPYALTDTHWSA
jgi:hypothetical protein